MDDKNKAYGEKKTVLKDKKKMSFDRFANLLYEASSSLVPGTGELYNTKYADGKDENSAKGTFRLPPKGHS